MGVVVLVPGAEPGGKSEAVWFWHSLCLQPHPQPRVQQSWLGPTEDDGIQPEEGWVGGSHGNGSGLEAGVARGDGAVCALGTVRRSPGEAWSCCLVAFSNCCWLARPSSFSHRGKAQHLSD